MFLYFFFDLVGLNVSFGVYVATMIFLVTVTFLLLTECVCAFGHSGPSEAPGVPETPASAIICAYLPNEADIIVETIEHFLNLEYEPGIQIILTYNTPVRIPAVEEQLEVLANRFPNLLVLCIENSISKAQNINAALDFVVGDFVGVFDADHRPELHSFSRAWRWLSNGYDVVQGHSVSRNPDASWMARMMAVKAECHFAVCEPGRTTRDGMGFYQSNGYWKSPLLKHIGMLASMKAADVDAGMTALGEGHNIAVRMLYV
jgi:cellulose synthase/poly-beta-1,6-N-acetylglucosamine synthase-like glycosyltransferase